MRIIAVDVGSSAVKAAVAVGGRLGAVVRVPFATRVEVVCVEVPAGGLMRAVERAIAGAVREAGLGRRGASAAAGGVDAIAITAFSSGVVVLDGRTGRARCDVITHQDRRSLEEARRIEKEVGRERHLRMAGNRPVPGGIGSTSLAWLGRHRREVFGGGALVGQVSSLIVRELTGEWVIDPSQAAFLGFYDIRTGKWNEELCAVAGVRMGWLPRLMFADEVVGRLTAGAARRVGLAGGAGIPVVGGLVDTGAAVAATGLEIGQLVHNAGSTDVLALCVGGPRPAGDILTRPLGTGAALPFRWLAASTIAAAGSAIDWARRTMFSGMGEEGFRRLVARTCRETAGGRGGAGGGARAGAVTFSPYLAGDRTSLEQAAAGFAGLTLGTTREEMLAAVVGSLVEESRRRFVRLRELERIRREVGTMGGAAGGALAAAMHARWPGRYKFKGIRGEALAGLVRLGEAAMGGGGNAKR